MRGSFLCLPSGQLPVGSGAIGECKRRRPEGFRGGCLLYAFATASRKSLQGLK